MEDSQIIEERKKKLISFVKTKYNYIVYIFLGILIYLSIYIRTLPMKINPNTGKPGLWDITRDNWTLGPDLDPFLFLRWAKEIVSKGFLADFDPMRYVPLGFHTGGELIFHSYLMAWFHNVASIFGSTSVEQSAVIFPVFFFAITVIAFFLLSRKIFLDYLGELYSDIAAIISSLFLIVLPVMLPRTIAGIPEKESTGFFFLFASLYFFLCSWKAKAPMKQYIFAVIAALFTTGMGYVWGGYIYIYLVISIGLFVAFILDQFNKNRIISVIIWIALSYLLIGQSERYPLSSLLSSTTTLIPVFIIVLLLVHYLLFNTRITNSLPLNRYKNLPKPLISIIAVLILGFLFSLILFGFDFIIDKVSDFTKPLIQPITDRLGVTVAENRQPYFTEWASNFGPTIGNSIPLFFWLFFLGSIFLYYVVMSVFNKKERIINTLGYIVFLFSIVFSRYSPSSVLNGTNFQSLSLYVIGVIALVGTFSYSYYKYFKTNDLERFKKLDFGLILVFAFFLFSIISARGAVRLIMVMAAPASIIVAFFITGMIKKAFTTKDDSLRTTFVLASILLIIVSSYASLQFYRQSVATAESYIPSIYTQQWQLAMSWVRENTPENAVFGHWWDYGYWLQSIGERATVLDGGNAIVYWNYLMGRHGLTGQSYDEALPYLYAHNTTHFLIDSTDIGKYGAFSSIGSDLNYDRASYITTLSLDPKSIIENKNSTTYVYKGGIGVDEDIFYTNGTVQYILPSGKAGLGAVLVERDEEGKIISAPVGIFVYQNKQYNIPFKYAYSGNKFYEFDSGIRAGIYLMPYIDTSSGVQVRRDYVALYLSNRTVMTQLARLYLYKDENPYFNLVHSEDDFIVSQLKSQNALLDYEDIVFYQGIRGPIRIWEISYPDDIEFDPIYVQTNYPDPRLSVAR
jgi:dolichyl-diphosphooligosaccharide--protein glycosyltransferase